MKRLASGGANLGMYPYQGAGENIAPAMAISKRGQSPLEQQYGSAKMLGNENIPPIPEQAATQGTMGTIEYAKMQRMAAEQKMKDVQTGLAEIAKSRQITPEQVQEILASNKDAEAIIGNAPVNTAVRDALLDAFKN